MLATLVRITPLNTATGERIDLCLSSVDDRRVIGLNGETWVPSILQAPSIGIALWNGDFSAAVDPAQATLPIAMAELRRSYPGCETYSWPGANVEIYYGTPGDAWPWTRIMAGRVSSQAEEEGRRQLQVLVDREPFNADILTLAYAGTTGIEGGDDLKNRQKPLILGHAKNVQPVLIDAVDSVYQFSAYGRIGGVDTLYERGSAFSASFGDYEDYAALVAAAIPPGRWATCDAHGLIRLGAPEAGIITGDVRGLMKNSFDGGPITSPFYPGGSYVPRKPGDIIAFLARLAGVNAGLIEAATLTALDTAAPYNVNIVLTSQTSFLDLARKLALDCNWQAGVSLLGKFFASRISLAPAAAFTIDAQGRTSPESAGATELDTSPPFWKTTMGANRSWHVHSSDEIAYYADLIDTGLYDPDKTYREGNITTVSDGSRWVYINPVPGKGNAPPAWPVTANAWWENMTPPVDAGFSATLTNETHIVAAEPDGTVLSFADAGGQFVLVEGGAVVTTGMAFSVVNETGVDVSINATTGVYTVASMSADDGTATFRVIYKGRTVDRVYSIVRYRSPEDGVSGYAVLLSNETHNVPATQEGVVTDFSGANGLLQVLTADGDIIDQATIGSPILNNVTGTVNTAANTPVNGKPKGWYQVTAMPTGPAMGTMDIPVTLGTTTTNKRFTVTKSPAGADGSPAKTLTLTSDRQTITFGQDGAASPSSQTISFKVNRQNSTAAVTWRTRRADNTLITPSSTYLTIAGDTLSATMTVAQFNSLRAATKGVIIEAFIDGGAILDQISIVQVERGVDAKLLRIYPDRLGITYDGAGALNPTSQTITFIADKVNTTATVTWVVTDMNGVVRTGYLSSTSGNLVTMTAGQFNTARNGTKGVVVTASLTDGGTTISDKTTVLQVEQGAAGVGFKQDSPIPTAQFQNQTWYKPTAKEWYVANAAGVNFIGPSGWVKMLGVLAGLDQVNTGQIVDGAINLTGYISQSGTYQMTTSETVDSTFTAAAVNCTEANSEMNVTVFVPHQIWVNNPVQDGIYTLDIRLFLYRNIGGTWTSQIMSGVFQISERWNAPSASGIKSFGKKMYGINQRFTGLAVGQWALRWTATTPAGNWADLYERYFKLDLLKALK